MKVCEKCKTSNVVDAVYCAECGEKLRIKKSMLGIVAIAAIIFISLAALYLVQADSVERLEAKKAEKLRQSQIPIEEKLRPILNQNKDTFETHNEFYIRKQKQVDKILSSTKVATATMLSYNAEKERIKLIITYDKGLEQFLIDGQAKTIEGEMSKRKAKSLFGHDGISRISLTASVEGEKLHINPLIGETVNISKLEVQNNRVDVKLTYDKALVYCYTLAYAGKLDWRLPTSEDLKLIYKNKDKFLYFASNYYWSSTTYAGGSDSAWSVYFGDGYQYYNAKDNSYYVRCVRVGQ